MALKKHPTIGCCGIDCGLCPRYYTDGSSRCPGCGGEGFEQKRPGCGFITCCVKKKGLEACGECGEYPCKRFEKFTGCGDSFVSHRKMLPNHESIQDKGLAAFLEQQEKRIAFLETALRDHSDGRSKSFYCIAAALLSIEGLSRALSLAEQGDSFKEVLVQIAETEGQELKLRK